MKRERFPSHSCDPIPEQLLQIRGIGSSWSVCSDPTCAVPLQRPESSRDRPRRPSDPSQDPLGEPFQLLSRRAPVRYASRSASMVESTLDPPIVSLHVCLSVQKAKIRDLFSSLFVSIISSGFFIRFR